MDAPLIIEPAVPISGSMSPQTEANLAALYQLAATDIQAYWHLQAQKLIWVKPYTQVMQQNVAHTLWFADGMLNLSVNCLDRHMLDRADKIALYCIDELGEQRAITYAELFEQVQRLASGLKQLGVKKGDRVALYMPMISQAVVAMLACARIGAIHTVVFAGFSAQALAERLQDAACSVVITADSTVRKGKVLHLKHTVDEAVKQCATVKQIIVVQQGVLCAMQPNRDIWYHELLVEAEPVCAPEPMHAGDPAFILYTSGTTGKPKGIVHAVGGYAVGAYSSMELVFDPRQDDIYWCTADVGWITGHTYVVYGPLMHGMTQLLYEGALTHPHEAITWELIDRYKISILYTAPTAIRMFSQWGAHIPAAYALDSLRLLGSVGEPLNPEAWRWYYTHIGHQRCPIVDTWWQTETGSIMICSLPGLHPMKPGCAGRALPGIQIALVNEQGQEITQGSGYLTITHAWPSMMRGIWADEDRFRKTYFPHGLQRYMSGDAAFRDDEGDIMVLGRVDDVLNVSGHRIGTMEIESAIVTDIAVAEAAAVGKPDELRGQVLVVFVVVTQYTIADEALKIALQQRVVQAIGSFARPQEIIFCADLPKTRSGKIMRRLLKDIVCGQPLSDTTTLANQDVVAVVQKQWQERCE